RGPLPDLRVDARARAGLPQRGTGLLGALAARGRLGRPARPGAVLQPQRHLPAAGPVGPAGRADQLVPRHGPPRPHADAAAAERSSAAVDAGMRLAMYYVKLVSRRRREPGPDLTSAMIRAQLTGAPLTDTQLVGFLFLMVSATNESTAKLLTHAWYHGWREPG